MKKYVITNDTTINEKNVKTWIDDFCTNIQPHLLYLDSTPGFEYDGSKCCILLFW